MTREIYFKSIPRSGHHFLTTLVYNYFGDEIFYCFKSTRPPCCGEKPCLKARTFPLFMHKSHDSRLADPIDVSDGKFLVQIREPAGQIASEIERSKKRRSDAFLIENNEYAEWWLAYQACYYKAFLRKWVESDLSNAIVIDYDNLKSNPLDTLSQTIRWFERDPDPKRMLDVVDANRLRLARNPDLDHEHFPFSARSRSGSAFISEELFEDYIRSIIDPDHVSSVSKIKQALDDFHKVNTYDQIFGKHEAAFSNIFFAQYARKIFSRNPL